MDDTKNAGCKKKYEVEQRVLADMLEKKATFVRVVDRLHKYYKSLETVAGNAHDFLTAADRGAGDGDNNAAMLLVSFFSTLELELARSATSLAAAANSVEAAPLAAIWFLTPFT